MDYVSSRKNPIAVHMKRLGSSAAHRREAGAFLCDGRTLLGEAIQWGGSIETVLIKEGTPRPEGLGPDARVIEVPEELLLWISPLDQAQDCVFSCALPKGQLPQSLQGKRYAVLEGIQDPGNVGAILRSAAAFRIDGVFLVGACADLWNPKTIRGSMGAVFRLPVWKAEGDAVKRLLLEGGIPLYGAALGDESKSPKEIARMERVAVAIGSEGRGLSQALLALCDGAVRIPMEAGCQSLNAATAAGILFWELYRADGVM